MQDPNIRKQLKNNDLGAEVVDETKDGSFKSLSLASGNGQDSLAMIGVSGAGHLNMKENLKAVSGVDFKENNETVSRGATYAENVQ